MLTSGTFRARPIHRALPQRTPIRSTTNASFSPNGLDGGDVTPYTQPLRYAAVFPLYRTKSALQMTVLPPEWRAMGSTMSLSRPGKIRIELAPALDSAAQADSNRKYDWEKKIIMQFDGVELLQQLMWAANPQGQAPRAIVHDSQKGREYVEVLMLTKVKSLRTGARAKNTKTFRSLKTPSSSTLQCRRPTRSRASASACLRRSWRSCSQMSRCGMC